MLLPAFWWTYYCPPALQLFFLPIASRRLLSQFVLTLCLRSSLRNQSIKTELF